MRSDSDNDQESFFLLVVIASLVMFLVTAFTQTQPGTSVF